MIKKKKKKNKQFLLSVRSTENLRPKSGGKAWPEPELKF